MDTQQGLTAKAGERVSAQKAGGNLAEKGFLPRGRVGVRAQTRERERLHEKASAVLVVVPW